MQKPIQSHTELIVWQKGIILTLLIYKITERFPTKEIYGLTSQIRRAAVSIPSNIAEGRRRGTKADFMNFLRIAHGSLAELETQLLIGYKLLYCTSDDYKEIYSLITEMGKMLHAMIIKLQ